MTGVQTCALPISIDEFKMHAGDRIEITLDEQLRVSVRDYGRGIPQGKMIEAVSVLNTGGKYDSKAFKKSVGLNGVGVKAVNALSSRFEVRSYRDGQVRMDDYTDALASVHSVRESIGDEFSLENLTTKYDEIMSMNVTPSTKTDLMDVAFDSDGNMMDSNGNYVEDNDSITSSWYYQNLSSQSSSDSTSNDSSGTDTSGSDGSDYSEDDSEE